MEPIHTAPASDGAASELSGRTMGAPSACAASASEVCFAPGGSGWARAGRGRTINPPLPGCGLGEPLKAKTPVRVAATAAATTAIATTIRRPPNRRWERWGKLSGARSSTRTGLASASNSITSRSLIRCLRPLSGCGLFFRELLREALPRPVQADRRRVFRAAERDGELGVRQSLPCGEAQDFLVVPPHLLQ